MGFSITSNLVERARDKIGVHIEEITRSMPQLMRIGYTPEDAIVHSADQFYQLENRLRLDQMLERLPGFTDGRSLDREVQKGILYHKYCPEIHAYENLTRIIESKDAIANLVAASLVLTFAMMPKTREYAGPHKFLTEIMSYQGDCGAGEPPIIVQRESAPHPAVAQTYL